MALISTKNYNNNHIFISTFTKDIIKENKSGEKNCLDLCITIHREHNPEVIFRGDVAPHLGDAPDLLTVRVVDGEGAGRPRTTSLVCPAQVLARAQGGHGAGGADGEDWAADLVLDLELSTWEATLLLN